MAEMSTVEMVREAEQAFIARRVARAGCQRDGYNVDRCRAHGKAYWPYDERACNMVLTVLGVPLRHALGDGRAEGDPRFPRPRVR